MGCGNIERMVGNTEKAINPDEIIYREEPFPSDLQGVKEIVESSGFFSQEEIEVALELVQERLLKGVTSGYHFLFAEAEGRMIGYACFGPIPGTKESCDLYWIAVNNDFRGSGLGKAILEKAEQEMTDLGGRRIYVETSSREQYRPTQSFYSKCGYAKEAVLKNFYSPGDDKIIYVKAM